MFEIGKIYRYSSKETEKKVQLEVLDDQYPIMLICGKKLAETVEEILFIRGISLQDFLNEIDNDYHTENRRAEDILSS